MMLVVIDVAQMTLAVVAVNRMMLVVIDAVQMMLMVDTV